MIAKSILANGRRFHWPTQVGGAGYFPGSFRSGSSEHRSRSANKKFLAKYGEYGMGVAEDFATFKDNYNISADLIGSISYRYKRISLSAA
jgi:hypothetical protein